jgi:hypothetical protein
VKKEKLYEKKLIVNEMDRSRRKITRKEGNRSLRKRI